MKKLINYVELAMLLTIAGHSHGQINIQLQFRINIGVRGKPKQRRLLVVFASFGCCPPPSDFFKF